VGPPGHLLPRWLFLRALGLIYFSAFYSLVSQIRGLLGPDGLLPAGMYLREVAKAFGASRYWYAPTLLWLGSSERALLTLCWIGMIAALLLVLNFWPRGMLLICFILFLSFVSAAQDFSGYQSDGMLLTAGFVSLFFCPRGLRPGLGAAEPPSRGSLFLLQILWFTIYFESGLAKYLGGTTSRPWTSIIKTARCRRGLAGMRNNSRIGSTPQPSFLLSQSNCWLCGCFFCRAASVSRASGSSPRCKSELFSPPTMRFLTTSL
jgi:hypothetical protein